MIKEIKTSDRAAIMALCPGEELSFCQSRQDYIYSVKYRIQVATGNKYTCRVDPGNKKIIVKRIS